MKIGFLVISSLLFLIFPVWSLLFKGPFLWHIQQPEAWQGGLEALTLFLLIYLSTTAKSRFFKYPMLLLVAALYSRRHGIDLSIIAIYIYFQAIFNIGWLVVTKLQDDEYASTDKVFLSFFSGCCAWLFFVWMVSSAGFGAVESIRIISLCVLGCSLAFVRAPSLLSFSKGLSKLTKSSERFSVSLIATLFLVLFAKISSVYTINYDSLWYGLQLEKSMLAEGSIFEPQGLVAVVHYYPKLYESLLIPFADLGSMSMLMGVAVFVWLAIIVITYHILQELSVSQTLSILSVSIVATIPALGHIAMTTKGDTFAALLALVSIYFFVRFTKTNDVLFFVVSILSILLSPLARLSILPYIAVGFVFLSLYIAIYKYKKNSFKGSFQLSGFLSILTTCLMAFIIIRTTKIAGVPFVAPNDLVDLLRFVGFSLSYPVGTLPDWDFDAVSPLQWLWYYLFHVGHLNRTLYSWIGNAWVFLLLMAILLGSWRKVRDQRYTLFLLATIGVVFISILVGTRINPAIGLDGNYFIYPLISTIILGASGLSTAFDTHRSVITSLLISFALVNASIVFVTTDWGPGTRSIDLNMARMPFEMNQRIDYVLSDPDRLEVYNYFKTVPSSSRVVGLKGESDDYMVEFGWWLPVRYEPIEIISWSRPEIVNNTNTILEFIERVEIDYILLPNNQDSTHCKGYESFCSAALKLLDDDFAEAVVNNEKYQVIKVGSGYTNLQYSVNSKEPGEISLWSTTPNCSMLSNSQITVRWSFPGNTSGVRIMVRSKGSASESLWAEGGASGELTTGSWVSLGTVFRLYDISNDSLISTVRVTGCR